MDKLAELRDYAQNFSTSPTLAAMPRKTLADKGINGPSAAHFIEETHTPYNFAYITITTGTSAFQNIVGVTAPELPARAEAAKRALALCGIGPGAHILFTYPPLVNVFSKGALEACGVTWSFLSSSGREALIVALADEKPDAVIGESSFVRATLLDAQTLGVADLLPRGVKFLMAGTPLDLELPPVAAQTCGGEVHDLYGCQEFGWLTLDGVPLRDDISLLPAARAGYFDFVAGGLPTGDAFPVTEEGHVCNAAGKILTYARVRTAGELVATVHATTAAGKDTVDRLAKGILRIKAKIVRVAPDVALGAPHTVLSLGAYPGEETARPPARIEGPAKTALFDSLLKAQIAYQKEHKADPAWVKGR